MNVQEALRKAHDEKVLVGIASWKGNNIAVRWGIFDIQPVKVFKELDRLKDFGTVDARELLKDQYWNPDGSSVEWEIVSESEL